MSTLAFKFEEIAARELKPELYELDGISRATIEAHYKLYQGYVNKRNEILGRLAEVDVSAANQVYSEIRALKVELSFAIGGIKNHEIYFEHLGGLGGAPDGVVASLIKRDFGSVDGWRADLKATGMAGGGTRRRSSRSTSTSTRTSSTTRRTAAPTSMPSSTTSTGVS
jgi:Fe-Mn family superoxide dismutase